MLWSLGGTQVTPSPSLTHLGSNRYASSCASKDTIQDKITLARRTAYSLLGVGFHGVGGVNNACIKKMLQLYILPRLLYALESLVVTQKQKNKLEDFYKDLLKRIQALPQRTANEAPYLLMGSITVEGMMDIRLLSFFGKIMSDDTSILNQICMWQLATKSISSNSWFMSIVKLAYKYGLPRHMPFSKAHRAVQDGRS